MGDYVKDIRKYIGHRPLMIVGASVIVENERGEILMLVRSDNHCWDYPGGATELDERVEDAAARELFEETGLHAKSLELFGVFSGPDTHYVYPNGDEVSVVDIVYRCRDYDGELIPQEGEAEELRFFAPADVPENLSPPIIPTMKKWFAEKGIHR